MRWFRLSWPGCAAIEFEGVAVTAEVMERLAEVLDRGYIDRGQIARVAGVSSRTVARWFKHEGVPRPEAAERLAELVVVLAQLSKTLSPQAAHDWLLSPNPLLSHDKPVDRLKEGQHRYVLGAVEQLGEGVFV